MKYFFPLIGIVFFYIGTNAQQVFAPDGSEWYYASLSQGMAPPDAAYYHFTTAGDTIVEGISCRKINTTLYKHTGDTVISSTPILTYTSSDTVFSYNHFMNRFTPLYIFNVQTGDTLVLYKPYFSGFGVDSFTFRVVVDSIDFIPINNLNLKRVYTSPLDDFDYHGAYIERIGSTDGFLPKYHIMIPENASPLRCYTDADISVNYTNSPCNFRNITGVNSAMFYNDAFFYPNPASNRLYFADTGNNLSAITIYDLHGRQVMQTDMEHVRNKSIDVSGFGQGMYLVEMITSTGQTFTKKILVE